MEKISIVLCLTHRCNLKCVYCYEHHDSNHEMSYDTAKAIIDNVPTIFDPSKSHFEFLLFGGEPLLRFELIKEITSYISSRPWLSSYSIFAPTNGTAISSDMKNWFQKNRHIITLGLSLDGTKETQDQNRSNSYDKIDFGFFKDTWPSQNVKMTISRQSLSNYAKDVMYIHSLGFGINGADFCIGTQDWQDKSFLRIFATQMERLVDFYTSDNNAERYYNSIFQKDLAKCAVANKPQIKFCGIGSTFLFFDTDGQQYPCTMLTPMNLSSKELEELKKIDYSNTNEFIDEGCFKSCFIYPICNSCYAGNYIANKSFKEYKKDECALKEIEAIYLAEYYARRIVQSPSFLDGERLYLTIEAIKQIKDILLPKYADIVKGDFD